MALNLITATTIKRDVALQTPTNQEYVVKDVEFTYMSEDDWSALATKDGDDAINALVVSWGEFLDADGKQIKFSRAAVDELLTERWAQIGFIAHYTRAIMGVDSKNFASSFALGQMSKGRRANRKPKKAASKRKRNSKR